jgi:hypothetical protein
MDAVNLFAARSAGGQAIVIRRATPALHGTGA